MITMIIIYNINMSNYILYKRKNPKGLYIALEISKGYGKGIGNLVGLGIKKKLKKNILYKTLMI